MDTKYILGPDGELYHSGIKGMRWGVRRYQNKDGSLTPAGKKRYSDDSDGDNSDRYGSAEKSRRGFWKRGGKKAQTSEPEVVETDEQKRERILKAPTAKDVYENRHLFSNKEVGDLYIRLNNENNIKNLMPKEIDAGKARADKFFNDVNTATTRVNTLAKAYNTAANIYNAFSNNPISLPKIEIDNTKGNKVIRQQEKKAQKKQEEEQKKKEEEQKEKQEKEDDE